MRLILLDNDLLPHLFVLGPQVTQFRRRFVDHRLTQLDDHGVQPCPDDDPVQRPLADGFRACVDFLCFCFLLDECLADSVVSIHQRAKVIADVQEHIVWVRPAYLLDPLYFLVVLYLLGIRRILNFPKLGF